MRLFIQEGIENGEICKDVSPYFLMQAILGSIEHFILPSLLFDKQLDVDQFVENIFRIVFDKVIEKET